MEVTLTIETAMLVLLAVEIVINALAYLVIPFLSKRKILHMVSGEDKDSEKYLASTKAQICKAVSEQWTDLPPDLADRLVSALSQHFFEFAKGKKGGQIKTDKALTKRMLKDLMNSTVMGSMLMQMPEAVNFISNNPQGAATLIRNFAPILMQPNGHSETNLQLASAMVHGGTQNLTGGQGIAQEMPVVHGQVPQA